MSAFDKDKTPGSKRPNQPKSTPSLPRPSYAPSRRTQLPYPSRTRAANGSSREDYFPVPVLVSALDGAAVSDEPDSTRQPSATGTTAFGGRVRATYAFNTSQKEDAQFDAGDVIRVRRKVNADWLEGVVVDSTRWSGRFGIFPACYVEPFDGEEAEEEREKTPVAVAVAVAVASSAYTANGVEGVDGDHVGFPDRFLVFNKELQKQWPEVARIIMDPRFSTQLEEQSKRMPALMNVSPLPVAFKAYVSTLAGTIVYLTTKDSFNKYPFYKLQLRCIKEVFGSKWFSWNKEYSAAKKIFNRSTSGTVVRGVIRAAHASIFRKSSIDDRTFSGSLKTKRDLLELFNFGIRDLRPRVFTYVITDKGFYCTECGVEFSKDFISKHAVLSNAAERVRMAGELVFYWAENDVYLIVDNGSGTYAPDRSAFPQLERLFHINLPFIRTIIMDYKDTGLSLHKERILKFDHKRAKQQLQGKVYATQLTGMTR